MPAVKKAKLSPQAVADLQGICAYIAADNPEAANRVRDAILHAADFLAENPQLGRQVLKAVSPHTQTRWLVVPKFRNYLLFYRPFQDTIVVIRILHAARDWTRFFIS